jgi:hypothetical protein
MASSLDGLGPHVPLSTQIMVETLPRLGGWRYIFAISGFSYIDGNERPVPGPETLHASAFFRAELDRVGPFLVGRRSYQVTAGRDRLTRPCTGTAPPTWLRAQTGLPSHLRDMVAYQPLELL